MKKVNQILCGIIFLILAACGPSATTTEKPPTSEVSTELTPGDLILKIINKDELPSDATWATIPAQFDYTVVGKAEKLFVTWEDSDTVNVATTNHTLEPEFLKSTYVADAWAITDTITAQAYVTDKATQCALAGFKDEVQICLGFDGEELKVALVPIQ